MEIHMQHWTVPTFGLIYSTFDIAIIRPYFALTVGFICVEIS